MRDFDNKWGKVKEVVLRDLPENKARTLDVILENTRADIQRQSQRNMLFENASAGATSAGNIAILNRVILPILRRVMPGVIANELVGVQPMPGPVAQIHTLRVRYAQTAAGRNANDEAFAPLHVNDIATAYSGNENAADAASASTTAMEGVPGNMMSIDVTKEIVEAGSRKLSARWTIEAQQDANAMQGLDLEAEIMSALAQHITLEIDQEILRNLRALPPTPDASNTYDQSAVSGQATFVGDEHAALAVMILDQANEIAVRTRREPGNWIVVSPKALTMLQSARASAFARTTEGDLQGPTNTRLVGTLNGSMKVFVDVYAQNSTAVLVGYKGSTEVDAGAFYCPYIPLTSSEVIQDPQSFEYVVSFLSRYGWLVFDNKTTSFGNSADYFGLVGINANTLSFF